MQSMYDCLTRFQLFQLATRNGLYISPFHETVINASYIKDVLNGKYWVPEYSEVTLRPCPTPPSKQVIYYEIESRLRTQGKSMGFKSTELPCTHYLLHVLATVACDHRMFDKDYARDEHIDQHCELLDHP